MDYKIKKPPVITNSNLHFVHPFVGISGGPVPIQPRPMTVNTTNDFIVVESDEEANSDAIPK
jgi:hypothetical protein